MKPAKPNLLRLAALGALALSVMAPPAVAQALAPNPFAAPGLEARYDPDTRVLTLAPPTGIPANVTELRNPPRIVAEWPGTAGTSPRGLLYGAGLVSRFAVDIVGDRTRVTVVFRRPLDGGFRIGYDGGKTIVRLTPDDLDAAYVRPLPRRTPRPAPVMPLGRITPAPMFAIAPTPRPPLGWAPPRDLPATPGAGPTDRLPMADPYPYATPVPVVATPAPVAEAPTPAPTPTPVVVAEAPGRPVFGSALYGGADIPFGSTERYPLGHIDAEIPYALGGGFGWDHLFTEYFGLSLAARSVGYTLNDEAVEPLGFTIKHRRDDSELAAGIRGRLPLGGGVEAMLQPGLVLRTMTVSTTHGRTDGSEPLPVATTDYLSSSWLAFGGAVRGGLGWRIWGPLAVSGFGEYRILTNGVLLAKGARPFFPLGGWRTGAELRLDFEGWGLSSGYVLSHDGYGGTLATDTLDQDGSSAYARINWLY